MLQALGALALIATAMLAWVLILMFVCDIGKRQPSVQPKAED